MNTHKPDPTPPSVDQITESLTRDLDHWQLHGFGRYLVLHDDTPLGLCGLSLRDGHRGLNLSYHLAPEHWGKGYATRLVTALYELATMHLSDHAEVFGLARPANPASGRVLAKCGFTQAETLSLGGAPTIRYVRALKAP